MKNEYGCFEICEISQILTNFHKVIMAFNIAYFIFLIYNCWLSYIFSLGS